MKIEKLPSAEKMKAEYDTFADEKEKLYSEYKSARQEAKEYSVIKQNVDSLLSSPKKRSRRNIRLFYRPTYFNLYTI
jgi:ElaB/YqjD/DUF883 family membrane-anchored ribosome-binding protein